MAKHVDPQSLSQAELEEYLDDLVEKGRDDTPEFHAAYAVWESEGDQAD